MKVNVVLISAILAKILSIGSTMKISVFSSRIAMKSTMTVPPVPDLRSRFSVFLNPFIVTVAFATSSVVSKTFLSSEDIFSE